MKTLVCDLGGTRVKLGLVDSGKVVHRAVFPSEGAASLARLLPKIKAALLDFSAPGECAGFVLGFPGLADFRTGRVTHATGKYADAEQLNLERWTREELHLPFAIENDARMACAGEWHFGAGRGCGDLVMMTFGTGIGTAAVTDNRLLRGRSGLAGSYGGHLSLDYRGRKCHCGNTGCAEALASTSFLPELSRELTGKAYSGGYPELLSDPSADAKKILHATFRVWGMAAVNLIHAYDPAKLILGGGLAVAAGERLIQGIASVVRANATLPCGTIEIIPSMLADDTAMLGGEVILQEKLS